MVNLTGFLACGLFFTVGHVAATFKNPFQEHLQTRESSKHQIQFDSSTEKAHCTICTSVSEFLQLPTTNVIWTAFRDVDTLTYYLRCVIKCANRFKSQVHIIK